MKAKLVESSLKKKGFLEEKTHHKRFIYFTVDGKKTCAKTFISHGSKTKDLDGYLINAMSKQCKLNKDQFKDLINCPMSREQYEEHLSKKGYILY